MKPSHFQIPRQLDDCAFVPSADPIQRVGDDYYYYYYAPVYVACVLAAVACACIIAVWG